MFRTFIIVSVSCLSIALAQNQAVVVTSAVSPSIGISAESLATAMGTSLSMETATAPPGPLPLKLAGVSVQVIDSKSVSRDAGLVFVSLHQINFEIPAGTATGVATVQGNNNGSVFSGQAQVDPVAPALFAIDTFGIAAATGVRLAIPTPEQFPVTIFQCEGPQVCMLVPIDPGIDRPVILSFYATGIRNRSSVDNVTINYGGAKVKAQYAGAQGEFPGLAQVNVALPLSLRGAGVVSVSVTVDGVTSNTVKIAVM